MTERSDIVATREIYALAVEMADRVSQRRGSTNMFFMTVQSGLIATLGLTDPTTAGGRAICCCGIVLAAAWSLQLKNYRELNRVKFTVIAAMEENLPAAVFGPEWDILRKQDKKWYRSRYVGLSRLEQTVPAMFGLINVIMLVAPAV